MVRGDRETEVIVKRGVHRHQPLCLGNNTQNIDLRLAKQLEFIGPSVVVGLSEDGLPLNTALE